MNARNPFQPHGPIPGYAPYQAYPDYVPPYDPHKPPGYSQGQWDGPTGDYKDGPPPPVAGGNNLYAPPSGPPPPARTNTTQDDGFDPVLIQAAMNASSHDADDRQKGQGVGTSGSKF